MNARLLVAESARWPPIPLLGPPRPPWWPRTRNASTGVVVAVVLAMLVLPDLALIDEPRPGLVALRLIERLGGLAALLLLALAATGGLILSTVSGGMGDRATVTRVHVFVAVLAVSFTAVHVGFVSLVPDLGIGALQVVVPFTRAAGPLAQACGVLAFWLLIAIVIASAVRGILPWRVWRRTHVLTVPLFGLACAHTVLAEPTGTSALDNIRAAAVGLAPCVIAWRLHARNGRQATVPATATTTVPAEAGPDAVAHINTDPSLTHPLSLLIYQITWEANGVVSLILRSPDGSPLPEWEPGAHIEVLLPSGRLRHYSLYGDPTERDRYRIAVLRNDAGRGGSREMHDGLRIGTRLMVAPPDNAFALEPASAYLLLAGGIGITGLLPMARSLARGQQPWRLIYIGRSRAGMALIDEVMAIAPGHVEIVASEETGRPDLRTIVDGLQPGTAVYCCGPERMISSMTELVAARPDLTLHAERFSPPGQADGAEFDVELRRTGTAVRVSGDQTILGAVAHLVPSLTGGCELGRCGRCRATVLDGVPDHRDNVLTDAERAAGEILLCVSRAQGDRLTLDL
ncbi:2Fe-2S iron-sulfur cluster-binding protein [Pseudonocardia acaciae]|uniref:2Fe-2S iron-sulfur cluster-binding protein n=1 Tax=Pseudonocardia acaciae TaxID=551276 RepID=UPI0006861178|nr:2Fe-2S iron-sulfur cluster-binding protein [Pseudonocardia acaciae]